MNKDNAIAKINKYGRIGKIITIIMLVIVGISMVGTLIAAIGLRCLPDNLITFKIGTQAEAVLDPLSLTPDMTVSELNTLIDTINNGNLETGINLGAIRFKLDSAELVDNKIVARADGSMGNVPFIRISNVVFLAAIGLVLAFISVFFGCRLCKAFERCESPFSEDVINKMRYFAFSLIPWGFYSSIPENAANNLFGNNVEISRSLDMNVVFAVLVILALTIVFKYGAILQQESDETL